MTESTKMVTVSCPNHHRELTNGLWNLLQTEHSLDYELKCGERSARAHGVMLRAFLSTTDSGHFVPVQEISDKEMPPNDDLLLSVLEFLYKGTVTLSREQLDDLQVIARQLDFRLLVDAVEVAKQHMTDEIVISRMDEIAPETSNENSGLSSPPSRRKLNARRRQVAKSRLPILEVEDVVCDVVDQPDISGFSDWQPDSSVDELSNDNGASSFSVASSTTTSTLLAAATVSKDIPLADAHWLVQKCYSCNFESTSVAQLTFHQASKHDPSILIYRCSKCRAKFGTEAEMQDHCQHCGEETGSSRSNSGHLFAASRNPIGMTFGQPDSESADGLDKSTGNSRIHRCTLCEYETQSRSEIRQHRNCVHHVDIKGNPISELRCSECDFTTWTKVYFNRHMRQEHPDSKLALDQGGPFECTICQYETRSHISFSKHQKRVHRIDDEGNAISEMKCSDCDYSTWLKGCFRRHRRQKHPGPEDVGRINRCSLCKRSFLSEDDLSKHMANHQTYKCNMCNFESQLQNELTKHRVAAHSVYASGKPRPTISCSECGLQTSCMARLRTHMVAKHSGPKCCEDGSKPTRPHKQVIKCKFCARRFRSEESLAEHMIDHPKYRCDMCEYESQYYNGLVKHKNGVHHLDTKGKPIDKMTCPDCTYSTMNSVCFSRHRRLKHTDLGDADWIITCSLCERTFKSMDMLNEHMTNHKTFKCSLCDFEGKKLHQLTIHRIAIHSVFASGKPRPTFDCTECDYKTPFRSGLDAHKLARHFPSKAKPFQLKEVISDTGEKCYECEVCEAIFSRKSDIKKHHQVNHAEEHRPHLCHRCGGAFKTRTHLNKHIRTVHKNASTESTDADTSIVVENE